MTPDFIDNLVRDLTDNPEVVTHSKGDGKVHLASAALDMLTLCGVEYDSIVRGELKREQLCATCANLYSARSPRTFADEMRHENELLRRRHVHATRPRGPMTLDEAAELSKRMEGES